MSEALQALTNETTRKKKKVKEMTLCSKANEALVLETILCEKPDTGYAGAPVISKSYLPVSACCEHWIYGWNHIA